MRSNRGVLWAALASAALLAACDAESSGGDGADKDDVGFRAMDSGSGGAGGTPGTPWEPGSGGVGAGGVAPGTGRTGVGGSGAGGEKPETDGGAVDPPPPVGGEPGTEPPPPVGGDPGTEPPPPPPVGGDPGTEPPPPPPPVGGDPGTMPPPVGGDPGTMPPPPVGGDPGAGGEPAMGGQPMAGGEPGAGDETGPNVELIECNVTAAQLAMEAGAAHRFQAVVNGANRDITANGIVNHSIGEFPNPGNPNTISPQNYDYSVPVVPAGVGGVSTVFGIALSGSVFDPGTAETWNDDPTWRYEALRYGTAPPYFSANGGTDDTRHPTSLGLDCNNAHVQPTGAYHYHGIPTGMLPAQPALTQVGWAGDGYPIFAVWGYADPNDSNSGLVELQGSWQLKSGVRPGGDAGPGGAYDGTFGNDWEYVEGSGDLDECNGREGVVFVGGQRQVTYHYMITGTFPYIPRCFHAAASADFQPGGGGMMGGGVVACAMPGQGMCCGDGVCGGPETAQNCAADCANGGGQLPACNPGQRMCCGDGICGGPETPQNCNSDC